MTIYTNSIQCEVKRCSWDWNMLNVLTSSSRVSSSSSSNWAWLYLNWMRFRTSLKRRTRASLYLCNQINKIFTTNNTTDWRHLIAYILWSSIMSDQWSLYIHWVFQETTEVKKSINRLTYLEHFLCQQVCFWFWLLENPKRHSRYPDRQSSLHG